MKEKLKGNLMIGEGEEYQDFLQTWEKELKDKKVAEKNIDRAKLDRRHQYST